MNQHLQTISDLIRHDEPLSGQDKETILMSVKSADKELTITEFKLDRTEKVKRTTAILLEETIEELEQKRKAIEETNVALTKSLEDLKAAQAQLVQQEKLASLGQLTAGIAHEIQNPLNFVNNFSDLSIELIDELSEEFKKSGAVAANEYITEILSDIKTNLEKIHLHGTRADGIVKSMLMLSRSSSGKKEPTDLNSLIRENITLTFHSMRAGKNPISVKIDYHLDNSIGNVSLIIEDFSRVIVNLCSNAFDAMREKSKQAGDYNPLLTISSKRQNDQVVIEVQDNGPGIPDEIKDKILQPFFTTKKGTEGTGLGLSITNDILKAHGGSLGVETKKGSGSTFKIQIPVK